MTDWTPGDLCICLFRNRWRNADGSLSTDRDPKYGETCVVDGVDRSKGLGLWLKGFDSDSYNAAHFRKVRPDELKSCDADFAKRLKRVSA